MKTVKELIIMLEEINDVPVPVVNQTVQAHGEVTESHSDKMKRLKREALGD